ncbi:NAD(P)/FAD-dependent oxidoreductase [Gluconobacter thailandicus]|uniref:FAD-dependent oxidoreductase n=1 Tax=Gluconobacter thailandicus TaxID=257438 RepID=A0AAP9JIW4_GLUTH|nr:FAD-dependent oxidoreductase [Gluconobacter thailandicus]QEH96859.1 FAD-dependent oxidoreductase [Gluconobacter thailandicus]
MPKATFPQKIKKPDFGTVIIGASHAGIQCASTLRAKGYDAPITVLSAETQLPYHRPPLSKSYMAGATSPENLALRGENFYDKENITLRLGVTAETIMREAHQVKLSTGEALDYRTLVIATGTRPRPWPGDPVPRGVHTLRTFADAETLRHKVDTTPGPIVIIGGGYVGLELAATLHKNKYRHVTIIEAAPRILARTASPHLSKLLHQHHSIAGVQIRVGIGVKSFESKNNIITGVRLTDGTVLEAAFVIIGIGVIPNQELAANAGLSCSNGIEVNTFCETEDPNIFAIGDCCHFPMANTDTKVRLECVQNAHDQARTVASAIIGNRQPHRAVPWFWSDQLGLKLQTAGLVPHEGTTIVRGAPENGRGAFFHFDTLGKLAAIETVNQPALHMQARKLLAAAVSLTEDQVTDPLFNPMQFLQHN